MYLQNVCSCNNIMVKYGSGCLYGKLPRGETIINKHTFNTTSRKG